VDLIINADDFGLSQSVNEAILDCHEVGTVSSASLLVNMPGFTEAVYLAKSAPGLGVGLHFNLTLGEPLSGQSLAREGAFRSRISFALALAIGVVSESDIEEEFRLQVRRFESTGIPLTHIDCHEHIQAVPAVFKILSRYCSKRNLPLRIPWIYPDAPFRNLNRFIKRLVLDASNRLNMYMSPEELKLNVGFASIFDLMADPGSACVADYMALVNWLTEPVNQLAEPGVLMVHPTKPALPGSDITDIWEIGQNEYAILTSSDFKQFLIELETRLVTFRGVP
jgi:predicted glycoside hydrolase/deacetylase ChbG (UPF0249 family)